MKNFLRVLTALALVSLFSVAQENENMKLCRDDHKNCMADCEANKKLYPNLQDCYTICKDNFDKCKSVIKTEESLSKK